MPTRNSRFALIVLLGWTISALPLAAQAETEPPSTKDRPDHLESAQEQDGAPPAEVDDPSIPEGMTLDELLRRAASPPPADWPAVVPDDRRYLFTFVEQFEWRIAENDADDHLGWEAQGWFGGDRNKLWWKQEGEAVFAGRDRGESETDLLYSRLITPFWSLQTGVQYANEWSDDYDDRWSGVIALQGLAPYKFEIDSSLYVSEDGDVTVELEAEYDLRITQRLVAQPRLETGVAAQDIANRALASGFTDVTLDLRLRYEIRREFAPYIGIRYGTLLGGTKDLAEAAGAETDHRRYLAGLRFAF